MRRYDFPLGSSARHGDDDDDVCWSAHKRESSCLATSPSVANPFRFVDMAWVK